MPRVQGIDTSRLRLFPVERYAVSVADGDTLILTGNGEKVYVRLAGIDAPESADPIERRKAAGMVGAGPSGQPGSATSIRYLQRVIADNPGNLQLWIDPAASTHGRLVGVLAVGKRNINLELAKQGLVVAYTPRGGTAGVMMGEFEAAQTQALAERRGLFRSPYWRGLVAMHRAQRPFANVSITDPENLGSSIHSRARAQVLRGMAMGDHRQSTYNSFIGMNTMRLDFGASRTPGNPSSMPYTDAYASRWRSLGIKADFLGSLDIETSGLSYRDVVTYAGFTDITDPSAPFEHYRQITPGRAMTGDFHGELLKSVYEGRGTPQPHEVERAIRATHRTGSYQPVEMDVQATLRSSGMSKAMYERQIASMADTPKQSLPEFMRQFTSHVEGKRSGWLFIHNANFESMRLGAAIDPEAWRRQMSSKSGFAAGHPETRYLANPFDREMYTWQQEAMKLDNAGNYKAAAAMRSNWVTKLKKMMRGEIAAPSGVKVVDTLDVARGVLAQGGVHGNMAGLLTQDALAGMMNMGAELHMPIPDIRQNLEMTARLIEFSDDPTSEAAKQFFGRAQALQKRMNVYSLYRDVSNLVRNSTEQGLANVKTRIKSVKGMHAAQETPLMVGGELSDLHLQFPDVERPVADVFEYTKHRMKVLGIEGLDAQDFVREAHRYSKEIQGVSHHQAINFLLQDVDTGDAAEAVRFMWHAETMAPGTIADIATPTAAAAPRRDYFKQSGERISALWSSLEPKTRRGLKIGGAALAGLGVLGIIRGAFEKERDPQPRVPYTMEQYQAMRYVSQLGNPEDDKEMSAQVASFRMVPNRYPTKVM